MTTTTANAPRAPFATILTAAAWVSLAGCFMAFFGRLSRLDGNLDAAIQLAIGGLLVGPALVFVFSMALLVRECVWVYESLTQRDVTGDAVIGRPPEPVQEVIRLLPSNAPPQPSYMLSGGERRYQKRDLRYLVEYVYRNPTWAGRDLKGMMLPSGDVLADYRADVVPFLEILESHGMLKGRGERVRGNLVGEEGGALAALHLL